MELAEIGRGFFCGAEIGFGDNFEQRCTRTIKIDACLCREKVMDRLARIFDFDFHASGERVKMGFGLASDYRIVQEHQGEIQVESEVGEGTAVTIKLPSGSNGGKSPAA